MTAGSEGARDIRAWKDCPTCGAKGWMCDEYDTDIGYRCDPTDSSCEGTDHTKRRDCPTCAAHYAAVDSAVIAAIASVPSAAATQRWIRAQRKRKGRQT